MNPGVVKAAGVEAIERILAVLASWNYAFQIRVGGVRSELLESAGEVEFRQGASGGATVFASDTVFVEDHVQAVVRKASLDLENESFKRYGELPEYLRSCLG